VVNIEKPLSLPAMNSTFVDINFVNWEKHLNHGLWLVDFWAEWCTACVAQDKVYAVLAEMFGDQLHIGKINVSDNRLLADRFGVRNIPFLLLMKEGKVVLQMPGIQSKEYLINQIKKQIQ
jgi:thioredoxin 1